MHGGALLMGQSHGGALLPSVVFIYFLTLDISSIVSHGFSGHAKCLMYLDPFLFLDLETLLLQFL